MSQFPSHHIPRIRFPSYLILGESDKRMTEVCPPKCLFYFSEQRARGGLPKWFEGTSTG